MTQKLDLVDKLFESYNYKTSKNSNEKVRIYTLQYGMYHAAEIISFNEDTDVTKFKNEFSDAGYATELKIVKNIEELEEYLFEGFFIKTPIGFELKNRYKSFVKKQLLNLPERSEYKYIDSDFEYSLQNNSGEILELKSYSYTEKSIINKISELFNEIDGALFTIIEAPAGFGKTCTANEILNTITLEKNKKLPFFTELSRNREARVFKHILLNEIDDQFPNGIKQNVVLEQIYKGRIPLIIDGFDELLSKESNKEDVESMLTTIIELLKEKAKIIITTRKTAILNSDEFLNTVYDSIQNFSVARFEIKEPTIKNWLSEERLEIINKNDFPLDQISNPVLLAYLRNIPIDKLEKYIYAGDGTIIDKYFTYLLEREKIRQNLKLDKVTQLRIFRKLCRFMSEYNITAESKSTIKDFIKDYNLKILLSCLKEYKQEEKPTLEELTETLSNHVFLDRKTDGNVGFVNDFIFGYLIAENLTLGKFQEHYDNFEKIIPQDFAYKSLDSFKIQNEKNRLLLWNVYNDNSFNYENEFYFDIDYYLLKKINRNFKNLFMSDKVIKNIDFLNNYRFENCTFSSVLFENCNFNLKSFKNSTFQNCRFVDCNIIQDNSILYNDFGLYACLSNNNFIEEINSLYTNEIVDNNEIINELTEDLVLNQFFQIDNKRPKPRKFSYIKKNLSDYSDKDISRIIDILKRKEYLHFKDDVGFITREAMYYLNHKNN